MDHMTLAKVSRISVQTLRRMQATDGPPGSYANNVAAIVALEAAGVEFTESGGVKPRRIKGAQSD